MNYMIDTKTFKRIGKGIFSLNKKKDMTSAQVVECVKKAIMEGVRSRETRHYLKVGHGGTLDKTATGVLVIGVCWGCKLLSQLLHGDKSYSVQGKLGCSTDTYNETGKLIGEADFSHVTEERLVGSLKKFCGRVYQKPPVYSALKRGGIRLSDIARSGQAVEVQPRLVECHSIKCTSFDPPYFTLNVKCGGGFYIRSLVHDLGIEVGSLAHVTELTRTQQGPFSLEDCLHLEDLTLENISHSIAQNQKKYGTKLK